jgi:predicted phosphoribosyltransferase
MFQMQQEDERLFKDRRDAGRQLATKLTQYAGRDDVVVLALPRGGVPVAHEIAEKLNAPLDVFIVRKLGVPAYEELAMGAIASGGVRVLNDEVIRKLRITPEMIESVAGDEERELTRREIQYRGDRAPVEASGKIVILVDDGLATGASMRAGVRALRQYHPAKIIVAVPVGAPETCKQFENEADEGVCGKTPSNFAAVGAWYLDFRQTTDEEVSEFLDNTAHKRKVQELVSKHPERYSLFV